MCYLNQYQFVKNIKSGGFGKIFVGKDLLAQLFDKEELFAIKVCDTSHLCMIVFFK
jgi:hypothetical protein